MEKSLSPQVQGLSLPRKQSHFLRPDDILLGADIGGTLAKFCLLVDIAVIENDIEFSEYFKNQSFDYDLEIENHKRIYLKRFYTSDIETDIRIFLSNIKEMFSISQIRITGGGSIKFNNYLNHMGFELVKIDELESLVHGYQQILNYNTMYTINKSKQKNYINSTDFPHLIVNIGSGVSIIKVDNEKIERIGGTSCGGGTLIGMAKILLDGVDNYSEIMELARKGKYQNLDLLVSDIHGRHHDKVSTDLESDIIASSFGKVYEMFAQHDKPDLKKEDIAASLLVFICFQISQVAVLMSQIHKVKNIFYFGNFTSKGSYAIELLDFGSRYWSKEIEVFFTDLDGFLGSMGTLTKSANEVIIN